MARIASIEGGLAVLLTVACVCAACGLKRPKGAWVTSLVGLACSAATDQAADGFQLAIFGAILRGIQQLRLKGVPARPEKRQAGCRGGTQGMPCETRLFWLGVAQCNKLQ